MSSRSPANVHFSLEEFSRRGGLGGANKDGWGIAWYVDEDVRLVKEPEPAADSACVRFVQEHPFATPIVVSHIRRATRGAVAMKNCQPFARELGGRMHVFAHNGDLDPTPLRARFPLANFHPVGDTDSEHAFCALLEQLRATWLRGGIPSLEERAGIVGEVAAGFRRFGPANFIYSDGEAVFIHGHKRRHADSGQLKPPGLYILCRHCVGKPGGVIADGLSVASDGEQEVVLAASVPLTREPGWRALGAGELVVARRGRVVPCRTPFQAHS
jgi:predicted glutamine amidotransferase